MKNQGPQAANPTQSEAKARQAAKIEEIRRALIAAGYRTAAEQGIVLGVTRSVAWALLNRAGRAGPSAIVLKRILSSQNLPQEVRRKVEEYIKDKSAGRYAHHESRVRVFRDQFPTIASGDNGTAYQSRARNRLATDRKPIRRRGVRTCEASTDSERLDA